MDQSFALEVSPSELMGENFPFRTALIARLMAALSICVMSASASLACNIPVFRYALERWQPDNCEMIVFHHGPLDQEQQQWLAQLKQEQLGRGDDNSSSLTLSDLSSPTPAHTGLWDSIKKTAKHGVKAPYLLVRMKLGKGHIVNGWHGPLSDAVKVGIMNSPARRELANRLLAGHSVVWLIINSDKERKSPTDIQKLNQQARQSLKKSFPWLTTNVQLPEGIGLPGSELHSEIPLLLKFTLLEIDRNDPKEAFLINLFSEIQPEAAERGEDLIIPVFGRGRALEVIPSSVLTTPLIKDLTVFLSGACSCQVKEQNPGFDLLMSVDWNTKLFGEGNAPPPVRTDRDRLNQKPELLTIPPGN